MTDEGSLKKYLLYAIGEILLVMVGILLALQVNNWNQNRVNVKKEQKALTDLLEEFKLNEKRIKKKQNARIALVPELKQYLDLCAEGKSSYQSFLDYHSKPYMIGMTNPSNGVIDALISSGELSLIRNDSLKYLLADWKDQVGNLNENELILWEVTLDYNFSFHHAIPEPQQDWYDWKEADLEKAYKELSYDISYRNKLSSYEACQRIVVTEGENILASIKKIMNLLKNQIR